MCLSFRKFHGWMGSLGLGKETKYQAWHATQNCGLTGPDGHLSAGPGQEGKGRVGPDITL